MNKPFFCITGDLDWASDFCVKDFVDILNGYGVKPTIFVTHDSPLIKELLDKNAIEVGLHPNFLPNSTQGSDYSSIIDNLLEIYPSAKSFRSHAFFDNSHILVEMQKRGILYDSNVCLHLQPDIVPLNLGVGGVRYPVFWEDDCHFNKPGYTFNFDDYISNFNTSGLKILNFHPFLVAANVPNFEFYQQNKIHTKELSEENVEKIRYKGKGTRTFLIELLERISSTERFYTFSELNKLFPGVNYLLKQDETAGRNTAVTDEEYLKYWNSSDREKQNFLRETYQKRNASDLYATSRDFHLRELEIDIIKEQIDEDSNGRVLDLGCGNGYTLISLASQLNNFNMTGVDFADNLIEGANHFLDERKTELKSTINFVHDDAIEFLKNSADNSYDYIITERFIQNLPSQKTQQEVLKDIYRVLKSNGKLLMCEGSEDGFNELNQIRDKVGLEVIHATSKDNFSSIRIKDREFEDFATQQTGFNLDGKYGFSDYFLISRVLHPLYVKPQNPRFDSRINELASTIQKNLSFNTGFGSNVLWVLRKGK